MSFRAAIFHIRLAFALLGPAAVAAMAGTCPQSLENCASRCMQDNSTACFELGKNLQQRGDLVFASQAYAKACSLKNRKGCAALRATQNRARAYENRLVARISPSRRKSCDLTQAEIGVARRIYPTLQKAEASCRPRCERLHELNACYVLATVATHQNNLKMTLYYAEVISRLLSSSATSGAQR